MTIVKLVGPPGSITFLAGCALLALVWLYVWPRSRRVARAWLLGVAVVYVILALPPVALAIAGSLPADRPRMAGALPKADLLIVFDGDNRVGRVGEATRVYRTAAPSGVWVLGGEWVADALVEQGIPKERLSRDAAAPTTREQVAWVARQIAARPDHRLAIVASRLQTPRIAALLDAADLDVALLPSPIDTEPPTAGLWQMVPTYTSLRVSRDALYEHAALAYYHWRGWIGPQGP